jgi:hypothetical protein
MNENRQSQFLIGNELDSDGWALIAPYREHPKSRTAHVNTACPPSKSFCRCWTTIPPTSCPRVEFNAKSSAGNQKSGRIGRRCRRQSRPERAAEALARNVARFMKSRALPAWPKENGARTGVAGIMHSHCDGRFRQTNQVKKQGVQLLRTCTLTLKMVGNRHPVFVC